MVTIDGSKQQGSYSSNSQNICPQSDRPVDVVHPKPQYTSKFFAKQPNFIKNISADKHPAISGKDNIDPSSTGK
jgi:hypothetical protein